MRRMMIRKVWPSAAMIGSILFLGACGGGGGGGLEPPPPPDLSGVWSGTWSGNHPVDGPVSGNWEAEVSQTEAGVNGLGYVSGDVDCTDSRLSGSLDTVNNQVTGTIQRPPCQQNEWLLTAFNLDERSASGLWTQTASGGSGTFTGTQIAKPGGPRISFFSPPGGRPGTIVTVVGSSFAPIPPANSLAFGSNPAEILAGDSETLVARVPAGTIPATLTLQTPVETAFSPRIFDSRVGFPGAFVSRTIDLGLLPEGVASSPDGRRFYVANKGHGTVSMIDAVRKRVLATTPIDRQSLVPVQGVAVSPDGRWIYVTGADRGVSVLHSGTNVVIATLTVPAGDGTRANPQGIAVSPDGRVLYVADDREGGGVTVLEPDTGLILATAALGPGSFPRGVAPLPDGSGAFLAFASASGPGTVALFDLASGTLASTIQVGLDPCGMAISPDGAHLYVGNRGSHTVSVIATATEQTVATIPVGTNPCALALSPDGSRGYVANQGSDTVSVIDLDSWQLSATIPVGSSPTGVALSPDGSRAYVTCSGGNLVAELGAPLTLNIAKGGNGIGRVVSNPSGISCGGDCQATFGFGTVVTLIAMADNTSTFSGWSGDPDCADGTVTMTSDRNCTANFSAFPEIGVAPGCFIATAAYGSPLHPHLDTLRSFRDRHLLTNAPGRVFVRLYYRYSPPLAEWLAEHDLPRTAVRQVLVVLVKAIEHPLAALLVAGLVPVTLLAWSRSFRTRRRVRVDPVAKQCALGSPGKWPGSKMRNPEKGNPGKFFRERVCGQVRWKRKGNE